MFKKIAIYGLAFGSAASAMHLIYFMNRLYRSGSVAAALPLFGNIVFTGLAVYFLIKSLLRDSATPPNLGKTLFASLATALLVGVCTVASFQYIIFNKADRIKEYKELSMEKQTEMIQKSFPKAEWPTKKLQAEQFIDKQFDLSVLSISQIQMCLFTGFVLALIIFVRSIGKK